MPRIHSHAPQTGSPYGSVGESAMWNGAVSLYRQDRLEEAYVATSKLGAGTLATGLPTFRMIEAEYLTRQHSQIVALSAFVSIEYCSDEIDRDAIVCAVEDSMDEVSDRLGLKLNSVVMVTILVEAANTPWTPGRHGFCVGKSPFAKVCLPYYLVADPNELRAAMCHEFAHAFAIQETENTCAMWLDEANAMQMGGGPSPEAIEMFTRQPELWSDPVGLSVAFKQSRSTKEEQRRVSIAYQQSALIGAWLVSLDSEKLLGRVLSAHNLSLIDRFSTMVSGATTTHRALQKITGWDEEEIFSQARPR